MGSQQTDDEQYTFVLVPYMYVEHLPHHHVHTMMTIIYSNTLLLLPPMYRNVDLCVQKLIRFHEAHTHTVGCMDYFPAVIHCAKQVYSDTLQPSWCSCPPLPPDRAVCPGMVDALAVISFPMAHSTPSTSPTPPY